MNPLRLKNLSIVPPNGYRFHCPEKSYWSRTEHNSLGSCLREMAEFYRDNGVPLPEDPPRKVEQELCEILGPEWCEGFDPSQAKRPTMVLGLDDFKQGMKTMAHNLARSVMQGKRITVEESEVFHRAHVCAGCHFNTRVSCGSCAQSAVKEAANSVANYLTGCPKTPDDAFLQNCTICKCSLKAKICVPLDIIREHMTEDQMNRLPDFCWIK
jgi:hypothetical protein